MIATISGKVQKKSVGNVIIETGGIGYNITLTLPSFYSLPEVGRDVFLLIHTHIREDAFQLFGFFTNSEKELFEKLISISGIGPKLAINILSGMEVEDLKGAIVRADKARIVGIPGVGKKMSERIILELKDKISIEPGKNEITSTSSSIPVSLKDDAVSALKNLGYKESLADKAVEQAIKDLDKSTSLETLIRESLKQLF